MSLDPWMCLEVSTYSIDEDPYRRMYPNVFVWAEETEPAEGKCEGRYSPWIISYIILVEGLTALVYDYLHGIIASTRI